MTFYLCAAEADRIQDLVFSPSRLREVVGASQLLTSFSEHIRGCLRDPMAYNLDDADILVCGGGAIRVRFTNRDQAETFRSALPNAYFLFTGATLTVAGELIDYEPGNFVSANAAALRSLRFAKAARQKSSACSQLPYVAVCASCGVGMAADYSAVKGGQQNEAANYLCASCLSKSQARNINTFLKSFEDLTYLALSDAKSNPESDSTSKVSHEGRKLTTSSTAESIGKLDSRNCVAYLKADLNGFGALVQNCSSEATLRELSDFVDYAMRLSLAFPAALTVGRANEESGVQATDERLLPVLPLIMAGDDCFILLPAPWSIDFTQRFCDTFSQSLTVKSRELGLLDAQQNVTVAAALVICKASYPHRLAYQRAEQLLEVSKRHAKRQQPAINAINFEVLSDVVSAPNNEAGGNPVLGSLKPYSTAAHESSGTLPLSILIQQRASLAESPALPAKRRAELRTLYDGLPDDIPQSREAFGRRLNRILGRIGRMESASQFQAKTGSASLGDRIRETLRTLAPSSDSQSKDVWGFIHRDERYRSASGMPDLIEVWRYSEPL